MDCWHWRLLRRRNQREEWREVLLQILASTGTHLSSWLSQGQPHCGGNSSVITVTSTAQLCPYNELCHSPSYLYPDPTPLNEALIAKTLMMKDHSQNSTIWLPTPTEIIHWNGLAQLMLSQPQWHQLTMATQQPVQSWCWTILQRNSWIPRPIPQRKGFKTLCCLAYWGWPSLYYRRNTGHQTTIQISWNYLPAAKQYHHLKCPC